MLSSWAVGVASASAGSPPPPLSAYDLDSYIAQVARAWEPYTTPDGQVIDSLNPADSGDNYGVILLADVMLKTAARDDDPALAETGEHIVSKAATLPRLDGPFNLLAIAALLHDGQHGLFPPAAWAQIAGLVTELALRVIPASRTGCLAVRSCYGNWRLVWSAGAAWLLASGVLLNADRSLGPGVVAAEIKRDLALAAAHAAPIAVPSPLPGARELSDPGAEPPSYHLFSCALLELIAEADPSAVTPALAALREQAAHYALMLMAPDGQLSFAGRSLDQSWVQAAGAALAARQALRDPNHAAAWRTFAERAVSYLMGAYPLRSDGILPIVPGLLSAWSSRIMDSYAALDQYEGLTLWFLMDALEHWPEVGAARAPLPADATHLLVGDLHSSGLVWGQAGRVWWVLSGRSTSTDPRSEQGLVEVKVKTASGWQDPVALRPIRTASSGVWTLRLANGQTARPVFTSVHGNGHHAVLHGGYREASGHVVAPATWTLTTTADGITLTMGRPPRTVLETTVWLTSEDPQVSAGASHTQHRSCTVSASGPACPETFNWSRKEARLRLRA